MILRLVSYATCPFVQRAELVLRWKGVAHETTYIDLSNKPAWFLAISPRGKVPVLVADGVALFESQAICEFLDETHPEPRLMSEIPAERARDRAWFAFASEEVFTTLRDMMVSPDEAGWGAGRGKLEERLSRLQEELGHRTWLSGDGSRFGMAEVAFAPSFTRLSLLARLGLYELPPALRAVQEWGRRVVEVPAVRQSVPADFEERLLENMRKNQAFILGHAAKAGAPG